MNLAGRLYLAQAGLLLGIGVLMVYSASVTSRPTEFERIYLVRHLAAAGIGVAAAFVAALCPARFWRNWAPVFLVAVAFLLVLVLIPGLGTRVKGAQRWLRIGGFSLQPSELAKIALPLWCCRVIARQHLVTMASFCSPWPTLIPSAGIVLLVLFEPDLGTSAFLAGGTLIALYLGGISWKWFASGMLLLIPASAGLWLLKPYQWQRITGFIDAWQNIDAAPYQIRQSLVSLGSGGWFGAGMGQGWQKLSYLPEANTDFVFAVIGEELGLSGTLGLLTLWCSLYICGIRILSHHSPASFEFLAGTTLLTQLVLQAALNVAVVTAMVPPKGISHPLISAGGSNLVVSLMMLGIVWSLSQQKTAEADSILFESVPIEHEQTTLQSGGTLEATLPELIQPASTTSV